MSRPRFDDDRDDDVAEALARSLPHDAPDGLDNIDLAVAGVEERDGIELRHVHAFGEELDVADYPALALAAGMGESPKLHITPKGARRRIEVSGDDLHCPPGLHPSGGGPQHLTLHERIGIPLRAQDAVRESHRARQLSRLFKRLAFSDAVHREAIRRARVVISLVVGACLLVEVSRPSEAAAGGPASRSPGLRRAR